MRAAAAMDMLAAPDLPRASQPGDEQRLANDGNAYRFAEFATYYGNRAQSYWDAARVVTTLDIPGAPSRSMRSSLSRERTPRGATELAAIRGRARPCFDAGLGDGGGCPTTSRESPHRRENDLTRPRGLDVHPSFSRASQSATPADTDGVQPVGDSRARGAPSQSSDPNSANRHWFVLDPWFTLEPLTGTEKDDDPETLANDPETLANFLRQFGRHDDTTVASESPSLPSQCASAATAAATVPPEVYVTAAAAAAVKSSRSQEEFHTNRVAEIKRLEKQHEQLQS